MVVHPSYLHLGVEESLEEVRDVVAPSSEQASFKLKAPLILFKVKYLKLDAFKLGSRACTALTVRGSDAAEKHTSGQRRGIIKKFLMVICQ